MRFILRKMTERQRRVTAKTENIPMQNPREHFSTGKNHNLPCTRKERNQNAKNTKMLKNISGVWCDFSYSSSLCFPFSIGSQGSVIAIDDSELIKVSFTSSPWPSLQLTLSFWTKLYAMSRKITTNSDICPILGMSVCARAPIVLPSSEQGMITSSNLQLTSDVGLVGCFLRIMMMKLGMAVPTTNACASPVAQSSSYLSRIINTSILNIPIDAPATLHIADISPANTYTTREQVDSGSTASCTQWPASQWQRKSQSEERVQSQACIDAIVELIEIKSGFLLGFSCKQNVGYI